jgi:type IV secretory pathway VirB2 component (pilin)
MGTNFRRKLRGVFIAIALLLIAPPAPASSVTCSGPDPAVVSVVVAGMQSSGGLNSYTLKATVVNLGSAAQPADTLQFVDIYKGNTRKDSRAIPPLAPGHSFTFDYVTTRSTDAGSQTTALGFRMNVRSPRALRDCSPGNGTTMVRF